ncbi:MAG: S-layer homology domain-containing protein, partial [Candidatus Ornithomonoglobus sp.]
VCTALNISDSGSGREFSDVSSSDWFYPYVRTAAGCGIVNGVSDTAFDPNAVIKREDMAAMLYRAINTSKKSLPEGTPKSFADEGSISDYAKESVSALSAAGIINGVSDTEFSPASTATRAQSAAIIYQYFTAAGIK